MREKRERLFKLILNYNSEGNYYFVAIIDSKVDDIISRH